tara:strand:- start:3133 stop:3402 length:270 start_codon:yes stop_codon:yes gene_type:complete
MSKTTTTTAKADFNPQAKASYKQVIAVCTHFVSLKKCPEDMKFGSFRGYLLNKMNSKAGLKSGEITAYLQMKSVPAVITKAIRSYKKSS